MTGLQGRLTIIFIVLAVAPLLSVSAIISGRSATSLERLALDSLNQVAQRVSAETEAFISARVNELQLSATLNDIQQLDDRAELETLLFRSNVYEEITILGLDGSEIARYTRNPGGLQSQLGPEELRAIVDADAVVYSDVFFDSTVREPLMRISFAVPDIQTGEPVYVLSALLSFRPVWELLRNPRIGEQVEAFLLSADGRVIAHRNPSLVFSEAVVALPAAAGRRPTADGEALFSQVELPLGDRALVVVAQRPIAQALALVEENQRILLLLTAGTLLLAIIMVVLVVRQIVRPIVGLAAVAERIRTGDLAARAPAGGRDEIGRLGASFNDMAGQLAGMVGALEGEVAERTLALQGALKEVEERAVRQAELLEQVSEQQAYIRALSVPLLPVDRETLVLPLVGAFDADRLNEVQERTLQTIQASGTRRLILDVTGVPVIDSQVAQGLLGVVSAARLLGATVHLVGIRPEVAQTIVGLGLDFEAVRVFSTLESALESRRELAPR